MQDHDNVETELTQDLGIREEDAGIAERERRTVLVKFWYEEGKMPLVVPTYAQFFPHFSLECSEVILNEILHGNRTCTIATYNQATMEWQTHTPRTTRRVISGEVLLYKLQPYGVAGHQLQECPGLKEEVHALNVVNPNASVPQHKPQSLLPASVLSTLNPNHHQIRRTRGAATGVWPRGYTVAAISPALAVLERLTGAERSAQFSLSFGDSVGFVGSTVRSHVNIYRKMHTEHGQHLFDLNGDLDWVKLVSWWRQTDRKDPVPVVLPPGTLGTSAFTESTAQEGIETHISSLDQSLLCTPIVIPNPQASGVPQSNNFPSESQPYAHWQYSIPPKSFQTRDVTSSFGFAASQLDIPGVPELSELHDVFDGFTFEDLVAYDQFNPYLPLPYSPDFTSSESF
ncbi:hypothetical protein V5O48_003810 [Marasmius crinis-equi]|uniref:Uncharacterized protein n=1 Tax=Marasmius crinis-equi TaxID=585013 RepID=A0ABR3FRT7_9AGAR